MMYDIIVQVRNQRIKCVDQTIVSDSRNYQYVKFEFDSDWDGLIKTAVFRNGEDVFNVLIDDTCRCLIPEGALKSGVLEISVFGGDRITATAACFNVVKSGYVSADVPPAPEPDVYASLVELAANAVNVANEVRADADAGKFNGAAGPQGPQGETGPAGKDGSSDWNTLENRPFYEKERIYKLDGNLSGRDVIEYNGTFYKVSDDLPTPDELNAGVVYDSDGNKQFDMSHQDAQGNETIYIEAMAGFLIVVYDKYFNPDGLSNHEAPSTGVYINANYNYELRLSNLIKTIDEKFLPDGIGGDADWNTLQNKPFGETREFDDIVWDNVTAGKESFSISGFNFYKVSSYVTDANMLDGHKLVDGSGFEVIFDSANFVSGTGITSVGGYPIVVVSALEVDMPDLGAGTAPSTGIYTFSTNYNFTISGVKVKKLDNQFIKTPVMIVAFSENFDNGKYKSSASLSEVHEAMAKNCLVVGYFPDLRTYLPNVYSPEAGWCKFSAVHTSNLDANTAEYIEFTLGTNQTEVTKTVKHIAFAD